MSSSSAHSMFASEADWPFRLHVSELGSCREFLGSAARAPRILRIFGPSGCGKSFLVRELMVKMSADEKDGVGLYIDVPPADLEAAAILDQLDVLLSQERKASRRFPSFVGRKAAKSWLSARQGSSKGASYGYSASRDLTAQIPVAGPFIKALLPHTLPTRTFKGDNASTIRFLMKRSKSERVLLVIDNIQFLPFAVLEMLATELAEAGQHLKLVLIERVHPRRRVAWAPTIPGAELMDLDLGSVSLEEVTDLVSAVLPAADDVEDIAATVFRRSEGNLKSVWFQLRLIASRRDDQDSLVTSYEDVILSLPPLDQAVLRFIVFTVGGLKIASLISLLRATDLRTQPDVITSAISDLAALGLLVVDGGETADRVSVEHELVAQVVSEITGDEEKLEFRAQVLTALSSVLNDGVPDDEAVLQDRLLGIVTGVELHQSPSLLAHVVNFVQRQAELDRHRYLASICRDSVCWDVLDTLPATTVRSLLDAIQKSALFSFGLIATARLRRSPSLHESLASLYEAKYLVQLFRYDEARAALDRVSPHEETHTVAYNIMLNLAQDDQAAEIAMEVYAGISGVTGSEYDYVVLRNSVHLFKPEDALVLVNAAVEGFRKLGRHFGEATALTNRGIVELASGSIGDAKGSFNAARRQLASLESTEVYQPLVNLSAVALLEGDVLAARQILIEARDNAPGSLMQDSAMLDFNALSLDLCGGDCSAGEAAARMQAISEAARRTRDLRFIDIVVWFADSLNAVVGEGPLISPPNARVDQIRNSGRVALEVFVPCRLGLFDLDVPYVLSPHWRH
jgi:tetratricopeptide (TPR) repeat protein